MNAKKHTICAENHINSWQINLKKTILQNTDSMLIVCEYSKDEHLFNMIEDIEIKDNIIPPFNSVLEFESFYLGIYYRLQNQPYSPIYKNKYPDDCYFYYDDNLEKLRVDNTDIPDFYKEDEEDRINKIFGFLLKYHPYSNYWNVDDLLKEIKVRRRQLLHIILVTDRRTNTYDFSYKNYYYDDDGKICFKYKN